MTRKRLSIAAASPLEDEADSVAASQPRDVPASQPADAVAPQVANAATLRDKLARKSISHSSFYASPRVLKALRGIAVERDCKVNDLICEGLRTVLARDGLNFDELNAEK